MRNGIPKFGRTFRVLLFCWVVTGCLATASFGQGLERLLSPAALPYLKPSRMYQISSFDSSGGNDDRISLKPGEKATIALLQGPGVITRIWLTIDSRDPYFLRRMVLRMFWDNETQPSVEVPVGDFFGCGFEYRHYISQFLGMSSGGYYCYFPMPFQKSARIEVENQTPQEVYAFYYQIDYQKLKQPLSEDVAYFHAQWRREIRTRSDSNYVLLDAAGTGHFVGLNLNMQSYQRRLWFLEGDEMAYVDGETFPSVYGTGTEDYFTSGWYFNKGEFAAPYHGLILKDDSLARIAAYRFQVGDAIPFQKSLRFTIEHGHANSEEADYSSTAFWYQKEPHRPFAPLLKASLRIPLRVAIPSGGIEAEALTPAAAKGTFRSEEMSDYGPDWSGFRQLRLTPALAGEEFRFELPGGEERAYDVAVYFTRGPDYGNYEIYQGGQLLGKIAGYKEEVVPGGKIELSNLQVKQGKLPLSFRATGKDSSARGMDLGLDVFLLSPVREYIPEWYLIGPFPNPRLSEAERLGLDTVYPPEREIDFRKTYVGVDSQRVRWQRLTTPPDGRVQLWNRFRPYELVVAYAFTYIYSPREQTLPLLLGSDDGVKVFLNGQQLHRKLLVRISMPDQDRVPLPLKKGWNELLLKIENNFGGYAFFARVLDPEKQLKFRLEKR